MAKALNRRRFLGATSSIAVLATLGIAPRTAWGAEGVTARFSTYLPSQHPLVIGLFKPWAEDVKSATDGRVTVEFAAASLAPPPRQFEMVTDGLANIGFTTHSYTPGRFPLTGIAELPFLGDKSEAMSVAYWRVHKKFLAQADEHKGLKLLALSTHGPGALWTNVGPIKSLSDLSGLKVIVPGGLGAKVASALGVVPVQAPAPKWYEILSRKVADGALFSVDAPMKFKLEQFLPYYTRVPAGLFNNSFAVFMDEQLWNKISAEDQAAIAPLIGETFSRRMGKIWDAGDAAALARFPETGATLTNVDGEFLAELRQVLAPVEAGWIAEAAKHNVDGAAAVAAFREWAAEEAAQL
jgi:TRAP-type C4-dicarboxylate transport system substrate-binding protein